MDNNDFLIRVVAIISIMIITVIGLLVGFKTDASSTTLGTMVFFGVIGSMFSLLR